MTLELKRAAHADVAALRQERRSALRLGIVPVFHTRLADQADAYSLNDEGGQMGYVLVVDQEHQGHHHVTLVDLYARSGEGATYEKALNLVRDELRPSVYLTRTDDCLVNASLLARGLQVEPTALVLVSQPEGAPSRRGLMLARLEVGHVPALVELFPDNDEVRREGEQDLRDLAAEGRHWVLLVRGDPAAAIARGPGGDRVHELLDLAVARASEGELADGIIVAGRVLAGEGFTPAAVVDSRDTNKLRVFQAAGYYTAAAYLVFYDPEVGRPSVIGVSREELWAMLERKEEFRLVDVLGEAHWRDGHLPGSEWIDFRGLAREAKRRFSKDEPIIVYCSGFT